MTDEAPAKPTNGELKQFIERIERLEGEKRTIQDDIGEVYNEAKSRGYDVKIIRKIVSKRRKPKTQVEQEEALLETYLAALGE